LQVWTVEGPGVHHNLIRKALGTEDPSHEQVSELCSLLNLVQTVTVRNLQNRILNLLGLKTWGSDVTYAAGTPAPTAGDRSS
jgi:hypothetical protein